MKQSSKNKYNSNYTTKTSIYHADLAWKLNLTDSFSKLRFQTIIHLIFEGFSSFKTGYRVWEDDTNVSEEESIIRTSCERNQVTLEYSERKSIWSHLVAAQRMILQLFLDGVPHLQVIRERRTDVQGYLRREAVRHRPG